MRSSSPSRRQAFTLLEVLLVAGLLVAMTALSVPSVMALLGRQAVMTAAGDVTRFLDDNRRRAVVDGVPRWVRLESGGPQMVAGPLDGPIDADGVLLDDCQFEVFDPTERLSGDAEEAGSLEQLSADWSPAVTFRPDGSSSDLSFTVMDDRARRRDLFVRGLTGRTVVAETSP